MAAPDTRLRDELAIKVMPHTLDFSQIRTQCGKTKAKLGIPKAHRILKTVPYSDKECVNDA